MTAHSDIEALIHRADAQYRTVEKEKRAEFAGVTAMTGLTILARHIDAIVERLDGSGRTVAPAGVEQDVADLRRAVEDLARKLGKGERDPQ
ncbi:MAG: hypothetical protein ABSC41_18065 [Acidimicrobiales bacterium]|jgi:hypothetical protein